MVDISRLIAKPVNKLRELWPTIFHPDQLAFPWGAGKRLRKRRKSKKDQNVHANIQRDPPAKS